jgi:hypothetical protein
MSHFVVGLLVLASGVTNEAAPLYEALRADGTRHQGTLGAIAPDWSITLLSGKGTEIKASKLISLRRVDRRLPSLPSPSQPQIVLANGGHVPLADVSSLKLANDHLSIRPQPPIRPPRGGDLVLPLSTIAVVWLTSPSGVEMPERFLRQLAGDKRSRDAVLLRNGEVLEGILTALDGKKVVLEIGKKEVTLPVVRMAALAFSTDLLARPPPGKTYAQLVLAGGARLPLASARLEDGRGTLVGKLLRGGVIRVPVTDVIALEVRQGCAVYLSDLMEENQSVFRLRGQAGGALGVAAQGPINLLPCLYLDTETFRFQHTPFLGRSWPCVRDGSVAGLDLRLGGNTYDKGLGMHSRSRLTFVLPKGYRWFETVVGLDDRTGQRGRARIAILLDGKPAKLTQDRELTARGGPIRLRLDVSATVELTLVVEFGSLGDVQSHVNWADARLVK